MRAPIAVITAAALLAGCNTPPKPSTVDGSTRRPANAQVDIDLQVCRNELHNTRLLADETGRLADIASARLASTARLPASPAMAAAAPPPMATPRDTAAATNTVHSIRFGFGSARVALAPDAEAALVREARAAPLVLLRGRTDGSTDTPTDSRLARERAHAVRDLLVAAGVDPARIRTTHQASGDHVADNATVSGRALNRRVEVELYRALPAALATGGQAPAPRS